MATVVFRNLEPRDLDFIHQCKTDSQLNEMVVTSWKPFTKEQSKAWLDGWIKADNDPNTTYKAWAIATADKEERMVGWICLSEINNENKSACFHGIVIGDKKYNDGITWIEAYLFLMNYVFEELNFNRLYGTYLMDHKISSKVGEVFLWTKEGVLRQASCKLGMFHDVGINSILRDEYMQHKAAGKYDLKAILKRITTMKKNKTL